MQFQPPIQLNHIERSHRLGPKTSADGRKRERAIIVRLRSERVRDEVYRSRFKLKTIQPDKRVFINEDLTARRAGLARQTRALKKVHKVNDCLVRRQKPLFGVTCAICGNNHLFAFFY